MTSPCAVCNIIATAVVDWSKSGNDQHIETSAKELGTWQEYVDRKDCRTCQSVIAYLSSDNGNGALIRSPECSMAFSLEEGRFMLSGTPFCYSDDRPDHICQNAHRYLELYPSKTHRFHGDGEYFTKVDPEWIDVERISRWLGHCQVEHGDECTPNLNKVFPGPARMIDIEQSCIVESIDWPRYAALSYVWGTMLPGLATVKSNISKLQKPGALDVGTSKESLAATVRDAMTLAKKLGFKYLWADRLCIIQDDDDDKMDEIKLMGAIYKNAGLTIIAMDGEHADYGLPGISSPRQHNQFVLDVAMDVQLLGAPVREQGNNKKIWHTRAWTYQERLLSSRKLCFFKGSYFWECGCTHWTEDIAAEADNPTVDNFYYRSLSAVTGGVIDENPFPDLREYCDLVEEYCTRRIGFDSDALNACSAILARLRPSSLGGFHFGLPEFYFDIAMLWMPIKPLERRPEFPSWSWLGWKNGAITHVPFAEHYFPTVRYRTSVPIDDLVIYPTVTWHRTGRLFPADKFRLVEIDNTYHVWRAKSNDSPAQVPGWDKTGDVWNKRSLLEKSFDFRYPVPVGSRINLRHELSCQLHCRQHLSFSTQRAVVRTGGVAGKAFTGHSTYMVNLTDLGGNWIGILTSNITDPIQLSQTVPEMCDVIVISEGRAKGKSLDSAFLEVRAVQQLKGSEAYEFYNVLAVEWIDDMALRTGVGRVWKTAWESLQSEDVDVKLG